LDQNNNKKRMKTFENICDDSAEQFKRKTGLSKENFDVLVGKASDHIDREKKRYPLSKRGKQTSKLSLENHILLTLYYLRHYPAFENLGSVFNLSESYSCKIYHKYARILARVETLPNRKRMIENASDILIIDASEQAIERPVKQQKNYYSGKKSDIPSKPSSSSAH
jgi:hypothetical protein